MSNPLTLSTKILRAKVKNYLMKSKIMSKLYVEENKSANVRLKWVSDSFSKFVLKNTV